MTCAAIRAAGNKGLGKICEKMDSLPYSGQCEHNGRTLYANWLSLSPTSAVLILCNFNERTATHYVLFTNRQGAFFDFTNKPMTYWVSLDASGPTGYKFVKKKLKF